MAKVKDITILTKLLNEISKINGIKKIELIDIPNDTEADIGIKIWLEEGYDWLDINHKINDLLWNIFEKTENYPVIYREYSEKNKK